MEHGVDRGMGDNLKRALEGPGSVLESGRGHRSGRGQDPRMG